MIKFFMLPKGKLTYTSASEIEKKNEKTGFYL